MPSLSSMIYPSAPIYQSKNFLNQCDFLGLVVILILLVQDALPRLRVQTVLKHSQVNPVPSSKYIKSYCLPLKRCSTAFLLWSAICVKSTFAPLFLNTIRGSPDSVTVTESPYSLFASCINPPPAFKSPKLLRKNTAEKLGSFCGSANASNAAKLLCVGIKSLVKNLWSSLETVIHRISSLSNNSYLEKLI